MSIPNGGFPPNRLHYEPVQDASAQSLAILSLVFGIIGMIGALIPGVSVLALLPAGAALTLGIIVLVKKKPGYGKALAGLILGAVGLLTAVIVTAIFLAALGTPSSPSESRSQPDSSSTDNGLPAPTPDNDIQDAPSSRTIPSGFEDAGAGLAWRFSEEGCVFYDFCVTVEVYAYEACPAGIELVADEIDIDTGRVYAETWEEGDAMSVGQRQILELGIFSSAATGVELTELNCYY